MGSYPFRSAALWRKCFAVVAFLILLAQPLTISAVTRYVALTNTQPVAPYTNWLTAATNIQDAIDVSIVGDTVLVTNGVYDTGNYGVSRFRAVKQILIKSVNGPAMTIIKGQNHYNPSLRCAYLGSNAVLSGFTLTGGRSDSQGGGILCDPTGAFLTNCFIHDNIAAGNGGGTYGCGLINCILSNNIVDGSNGSGGAAYSAVLTNCLVIGNRSAYQGGGLSGGSALNCILSNNIAEATNALGGGAYAAGLTNCLVISNYSTWRGAGVAQGSAVNCTIVSNSAASSGGGVYFATARNSIVFYNEPDNYVSTSFANCCTTPLPGGSQNFTNAPPFVDSAHGDFHLRPWSPCVNGGNTNYVTVSTDLDGKPRLAGSTVDMGTYEMQRQIRCVNPNNSTPRWPFDTWATAENVLHIAVYYDADPGDLVIVTNGVYNIGGGDASGFNRVVINKAVDVQSINGPLQTIIAGDGTNSTPGTRGAYLVSGASLSGFTITNCAGGILCASTNAFVKNCIIRGNAAQSGSGGVGSGTLINCIIDHNYAGYQGGAAINSILINCTVAYNQTGKGDGYGCLWGCTLRNSIVYYNAPKYADHATNCCVESFYSPVDSVFTSPPLFVSGSDYHLTITSPCINAGRNDFISEALDFDGNPRKVGFVDVGAYEFQTPASTLSYAWAQQFGLPIDGFTDNADADGDGQSNWSEWKAHTSPTDPNSLLKLLSPAVTNGVSGATISWQSVAGVTYSIERSANLGLPNSFTIVRSGIIGQTNVTSYVDSTATDGGPYFYRVSVQ